MKDHLRYIVTTNQSSCTPITIGARLSQNIIVKERVRSDQCSIEHISTNSMIADPLTKGLPPKVFYEHTTHIGVVSIDDL